jgi:hypothetical protein
MGMETKQNQSEDPHRPSATPQGVRPDDINPKSITTGNLSIIYRPQF